MKTGTVDLGMRVEAGLPRELNRSPFYSVLLHIMIFDTVREAFPEPGRLFYFHYSITSRGTEKGSREHVNNSAQQQIEVNRYFGDDRDRGRIRGHLQNMGTDV